MPKIPEGKAFLTRFKGKHILMSQLDKEKNPIPWHHDITTVDTQRHKGETISKLKTRNNAGNGIFFTINDLDQSLFIHPDPTKKYHRKKEMLTHLRALYADDDIPRLTHRTDFIIPPSLIVQSSGNPQDGYKFHYYWLFDEPLPATHDSEVAKLYVRMLKGLAQKYDTDGSSSQVNRVLRIPGFNHMKGVPQMVELVHAGDSYQWEKLKEAFPPLIEEYKPNGEYKKSGVDWEQALQNIHDKKGEEAHPNYLAAALSLANDLCDKKVAMSLIKGEVLQAFRDNNRPIDRGRVENIEKAVNSAYAKVEREREAIPDEDIDHRENISESLRHHKLSDEMLAPKDKFGEMVRAIDVSRYKPNLMTAFTATTGTLGYMIGGKYALDENNQSRARIYIIVVGDASAGKGTVVESPSDALLYLHNAHKHKTLGLIEGCTDTMGSREGLEDMLVMNPDLLFCWDEFGHALVESQTNNSSSRANIMRYLLRLWPIAHKVTTQRPLANTKETVFIHAPHAVVIGAATEHSLVAGLTKAFVDDGLGARFLFFPINGYALKARREPEAFKLSSELQENLLKLYKGNPEATSRMDARITNPKKVKYGDGVLDYFFDEVVLKVDALPFGSLQSALSGRKIVNVKALAMIRAIVNNPENPMITLEYAKWADAIVSQSIFYQYRLFKDRVAEGEFDAAVLAVVNRLKQAEGKWVKRSPLIKLNPVKRTKGQWKQVLELVELGNQDTIEVKDSKGERGQHSKLYRYKSSKERKNT